MKISSEASADALHNLFNDMLTGNFPDDLKLADITPVFKRKDSLHKVNYRSVSVLPSISKVFKKLMQKQMSGYISNYLSPNLCGYRKDFSSQRALLSLIENWKNILDKKGFSEAVLMDLSKAFDTIKPDLLVYAGHYSAQSGKLRNLCFLTGYQKLIGQRTFFALGSSLEMSQSHVTTTSLSTVTKK